jgi:hypothetical protein
VYLGTLADQHIDRGDMFGEYLMLLEEHLQSLNEPAIMQFAEQLAAYDMSIRHRRPYHYDARWKAIYPLLTDPLKPAWILLYPDQATVPISFLYTPKCISTNYPCLLGRLRLYTAGPYGVHLYVDYSEFTTSWLQDHTYRISVANDYDRIVATLRKGA